MADQRLPRVVRIRHRLDFQRIYRARCIAGDDNLLVYGGPNGLPYPRLGLSVSRKIGNAVRRNRWRRLLREAFRISRPQLPAGVDLIVIPRPAAKPELAALLASLARLAARVGRKLAPRTQSGGLSTPQPPAPSP
ncbi:MAG: ribonuclease P protein component [Thermoguttaceae bacterium]